MTLKAAWITPMGKRGPYTLTLESAELGPGHQLPVKERVFPETPADASKRHVVLLQCLDADDLDMLERLIHESRSPGGQTFELATVRMDEDQPPTEGL